MAALSTIFWHTERMPETAPLTLHQADQTHTDFDFAAIESDLNFIRTASPVTADAPGLGEDTVDLDFLGCRPATYLDLRDLIDRVEIPETTPRPS
jgi:hypothetical protein